MRIPTTVAMLAIALGLFVCVPSAAVADSTDAAQKAFDKGDFDKAADLFAKAAKAAPDDREAALGLGRASIKAARQDLYYDALDALSAFVRKDEKDLDVQITMGEVNIAIANTKSDPQALKGYFADAQDHFERAVAIEPTCEAATVGLAQSLYFVGDFPAAVRAVDLFMARNPTDVAQALYWKGQALFVETTDAYRAAGELNDDVKAKARAAMDAYVSSAAADPGSYDTWIQLAYAAAYALDETTAGDAYRKAIGADPTQLAPLKGIATLFQHDPDTKSGVLEELAREHPKSEPVLLYAAFDRYSHNRLDEAGKLFAQLAEVAKDPASAWYYIGQIAEKRDDAEGAKAAYTKALGANSNYPEAAQAFGMLLFEGRDPGTLSREMTVASGKALVAAHEKLFKIAPTSIWIRNNLGLVLRDAWVAHTRGRGGSDWDTLLKAGADAYESASAIIGEWDDRLASSLAWRTRYDYAQVVSDTGLMFQFHPPIKDEDKAVEFYVRALEYSDHGYFDAFNNLRKIYAEKKDWESLYDLAELCADGLVQADRSPNNEGRAQARAIMKQLLDSGKVSGN